MGSMDELRPESTPCPAIFHCLLQSVATEQLLLDTWATYLSTLSVIRPIGESSFHYHFCAYVQLNVIGEEEEYLERIYSSDLPRMRL